jgi:hypothetical protein
VINTNDVAITYELHVMRAHLLHYTSLLRDFAKSVEFVRDTPNPAMDSDANRESDKTLLKTECENLLSEIHRLQRQRKTLDDRVQNVQKLVSANFRASLIVLSIMSSRYTQALTSKTVKP